MGCASYHHLASEHERLSKRLHQIFKEKESVYDDKILLETEVAQLKRNFYDALNQSETMKKEIDIYQSREYPEIFESSNVGTDEVSEWLEMDLRDGDRLLEVLMEVHPPATSEVKKLQAISGKMSSEYSSLADYLAYFHKRYALFHDTWKDIIVAQRIVDSSMQHLKEDLAAGIQGVESFLGKRSDALTELQMEFRRISALPSFQFVAEQRILQKKLAGYRADMAKQKLEERDVEKQRVVNLFEGEIKRQSQRHKSEIDHLKGAKGGIESVIRAEIQEEYSIHTQSFETTIATLQERLQMLTEELLATTMRMQAEKEEIQTVLTEEIEQRIAETKQMKDLIKHEKAIISIKQSEESSQIKKENEAIKRQLQSLSISHKEELERLRKTYEDEDSLLKQQHSAELQTRDQVLTQLKADFLAKGDVQKAVYEEKVSAEREKHQEEMRQLEEEVAKLVRDLGQREVIWKDEMGSLQGLIEGLMAKVELMDAEAGALLLERSSQEAQIPSTINSKLRERINIAKELLWKLPADSTFRISLEKSLNFPLNTLISVLSNLDMSTNATFHLETEELRQSVESLKQQLDSAKRLEREMRESQDISLTQRQEMEEQSALLQRYLEDLSHRDAKIKELAEGKRQQEVEKQAMEVQMRLKYTISRMSSYGQILKRAAVYRWRIATVPKPSLPRSTATTGHIRAGSAPNTFMNKHFSFATSATVEQVFAEEKRQLFDTSSLGGLFRSVSRTETPLLSQQTFKLMDDILERKYEADLSAQLRHSRPKPIPVFALEHLKRTIGNQKLAQKTLGQALICLLRHMREGQPYAELFCKLLNIGVSDPISLELGVFIVKTRADFTKFTENYYHELPDKQAAVDLEGGCAFLVDIISYVYNLFDKDPKSGELALKLIKPPEVPIEQYVMFKICHKMAKTGVNAEGTFEIIDTDKTGVIEQEEFVESIRKVLELWISPEDINEAFAELAGYQPVLRRRAFLEKLNFKQYLQDGLSERFSISRAKFLNVLVEVAALRERQIAAELFELLGSDTTTSMRQFSTLITTLDASIDSERLEWLWHKAEELSAGSDVTTKAVVRTLLRHRVGEYAESPFCMIQPDEGRFDPSLQPLMEEGSDSNSFTEAEALPEGVQSLRLTI